MPYEAWKWKSLLRRPLIKDTHKAFDDFKNQQKSVLINIFWYVKVCIFWKCIQDIIRWDKTQMLKNACFFLLFFYFFLKHKIRLSMGFFIFNSISFWLNFIFCMDSLTLKRHNFFQNYSNRKATHSFVPRLLIFKM